DAEKGVDWPAVARTKLAGRREPDWLQRGDILFSARGQRNVAVCIEEPPERAVCSPHFFLVRVKAGEPVLPEFLAWQINLPEAQRALAPAATGSHSTRVGRQALEAMPLHVPSVETQRRRVDLTRAVQREEDILEQLIENRRREVTVVVRELLGWEFRGE